MKTYIGSDGSLAIPPEIREADAIEPGQECEFERVGHGEYRVRIALPRPRRTLVDVLLDCPVKGFFQPLPRSETTDDLPPSPFE